MSARTRHAAELAVRLSEAQFDGPPSKCYKAGCRNPAQIAQDVDKLLRLSASLSGIAAKRSAGMLRKCIRCQGGLIAACPSCSGDGTDHMRERGLTQVITDTLKPYGLTWIPAGPETGAAVYIVFANDGHFTL